MILRGYFDNCGQNAMIFVSVASLDSMSSETRSETSTSSEHREEDRPGIFYDTALQILSPAFFLSLL